MSENDAKVVDLDATPAQAGLLAERIAEWLLAEGVIGRNPQRDDLWQPSEWMPGPHWRKAVEATGAGFANRGVDLIVSRQVHDPGANLEPPPCPACNVPADIDRYIGLIQPWLDGPEPSLACPQCGSTHLIGDWRWRFGFAVGNFAVRFNNWPILSDAFVDEIERHLSGRSALILGHY